MNSFLNEVDANHRRFYEKWSGERSEVENDLAAEHERFAVSYRRLTSLSAWRAAVIDNRIPTGAVQFFAEAHNDVVSSHVFARMGAWRASLKFLRSAIENILSCQYYATHPVELELWVQGNHRLTFSELTNYFRSHPRLSGLPDAQTGLQRLTSEYSTLSRAVHGSATPFRMTETAGHTNLWTSDVARLGAWNTRERHVLKALNLLLIALHSDDLQGAANPGLRRSLGLVFGSARERSQIRDWYGVQITAP